MATDYSHRFHAGNVGDVWKHCVLVDVLCRVAGGARVHYFDTHAGEGSYELGPTGEWTEGIGRLRGVPAAEAGEGVVGQYLDVVARLAQAGRSYPGSPAFAACVLGEDARLRLWERDGGAHGQLLRRVRADPRAQVVSCDGLAGLADAVRAAEAEADDVVVLIDPSYATKDEWVAVPDALAAAVRATQRARFLFWYPIKSLTRPNAMMARLEAGGVGGTAAEIVTTPLEHQRNRLNGSGMILVRPPHGSLAAIGAAAPVIGARCATRPGVWSMRMRTWSGGARA